MLGWCSSMELGEGTKNTEIYKRALYLSPRGFTLSYCLISQVLMLFASRTAYLEETCQYVLHSAAQLGWVIRAGFLRIFAFLPISLQEPNSLTWAKPDYHICRSSCHKKHRTESQSKFQLVLHVMHSYKVGIKTLKYHTAY